MKRHEKIATPICDDVLSHHISWGNIQGLVIVLTIEELRQLYDDAYMIGYKDKGMVLSEYLKSKGIEI